MAESICETNTELKIIQVHIFNLKKKKKENTFFCKESYEHRWDDEYNHWYRSRYIIKNSIL